MDVILKFETDKELDTYLENKGSPEFAAYSDAEPKTWFFAFTKRHAVFEALHLAPTLALDQSEDGDVPVWKVEGLESLKCIEAIPQFVTGGMNEAWDKLMRALDELIPQMPVSVFRPEGGLLNLEGVDSELF